MSRAMITEAYLTDIADAIRAKLDVETEYTPPQMAAAIESIPTGGDVEVEALSVTQNGTYTAPTGKAYSPVTVDVSGGGGGLEGEIAISGGAVQSSGVEVVSQPVIDAEGMTASASSGLQFSFNVKLVIEFDLIINSNTGSNIIWSFGGSNTNGGVYTISTNSFGLYASGQRFSLPISLSVGVEYRIKMELTGTQALLYADGNLIATGSDNYVKNGITYALDDDIALLYNQSAHSEYNSSHVDNIRIAFEKVTA